MFSGAVADQQKRQHEAQSHPAKLPIYYAVLMLDDHSKLEPPDPIPNSEVKRLSADGSVGSLS